MTPHLFSTKWIKKIALFGAFVLLIQGALALHHESTHDSQTLHASLFQSHLPLVNNTDEFDREDCKVCLGLHFSQYSLSPSSPITQFSAPQNALPSLTQSFFKSPNLPSLGARGPPSFI